MSEYSSKLFEAVFEYSPVGLVLVNKDTTLRDVNNYMFKSFGFTPHSIQGEKFGNVFHCAAVENGGICGGLDACKDCTLRSGVTLVLNEGVTIPDTVMDHNFIIGNTNQKKWFKVSASRIQENGDIFAVVSFVDISTQKQYEELLQHQLSIDLATGTTNKYTLLNTLKSFSLGKENISIAMIDFDNFKSVNDTYGHIVGDRVLNIFSSVAIANTRKNDIVGRFGGEEFMLIFPGASAGFMIQALKRINKSLIETCNRELNFSPTFSAGIAEFSAKQMQEMNVDDIISEADHNLYLSKSRGKNLMTCNGVSISY